jgi:hypothetical protein
MTEPALFAEAAALIRGEQYDAAIERLMAGIADLPVEHHSRAFKYAGLAFYFSESWASTCWNGSSWATTPTTASPMRTSG